MTRSDRCMFALKLLLMLSMVSVCVGLTLVLLP